MGEMLRLALLGRPEIVLDDEPVSLVSSKARAVLFYLALNPGEHSRQGLAGLLWGDLSEEAARSNLRVELTKLRRAVGHHLLIERRTVAMDYDQPFWLDVRLMEAAVTNPDAATSQLEAAATLYRGEFLTDFHVYNALEFEDWLLAERERLRQLAQSLFNQLVERYRQLAALDQALKYARRILEIDPWHEESHRTVMTLLAQLGQRTAALEQYGQLVTVLDEEFGIEPEVETRTLYEQIRQDAIERLEVRQSAVPLETAVRRHNLPAPSTPFVGRQEELARVRELLHDESCHLLTLLGPGGIGKTRLAVEAARRGLDSGSSPFTDGVYLVALAPLKSDEFVVPAINDVLHVTAYSGADPRQQLLNYLREKRLLLILDNCEHLPGMVDLAADIIREAPEVTMLATSRNRLGLYGEWVFELQGLTFPSNGRSEQGEFSAVDLFRQSAQRVNSQFQIDEADQAHVDRICQLVSGIPLALELAAFWVSALSCAEIAVEIEHSFDFLTTSWRDLPERHRSLRAVFEYSWALLSDAERQTFARLSVFQGGFTREAAQSVAGATLPVLKELTDKSFLRWESSGRYELHEIMKQYAGEKLGDVVALRERHVRFYTAFVAAQESDLIGAEQKKALIAIRQDIENIRQAWQLALEQRAWAAIDNCLNALYLFYDIRSWTQEGERTYRHLAAQLAGHEPGSVEERLYGRVLTRQAVFLTHLSRYNEARSLLQQSEALFRERDDERELALALIHLANVEMLIGDYEAAGDLSQASLERFRRLGHAVGVAKSLRRLGYVALADDDLARARSLFEEGLATAEQSGNKYEQGLTLVGLANTLFNNGDYPSAMAHTRQAMLCFREVNHRQGEAGALNNLANSYIFLGNYNEARYYLEQAWSIFHDIGDRSGQGVVLCNLGSVSEYLRNYEGARKYLEQSLYLFQEMKERSFQSYALTFLGKTLVRLSELDTAAEAFDQALQMRREMGQTNLAMESLAGLALVDYEEGRLAEAVERVEEILAHLEDGTLNGTEEPTLIYLTLYKILRATNDPRSESILQAAHALLQERAGRLVDDKTRQMYLHNVPSHREILSEFARRMTQLTPVGERPRLSRI